MPIRDTLRIHNEYMLCISSIRRVINLINHTYPRSQFLTSGKEPLVTAAKAIHVKMSSQSQRVLSIQSHVVSGYVGNKCAVFPLQILGFEVDFINSVQFSNHTGYGKWKGQVLTDKDLDDLFVGLQTNDLVKYNQVLTGYVGAESFLRKIKQVVEEVKKLNPATVYLCDPVLGDNGHFYVPKELIPVYQNEILPLADITTPNTFELELLSDTKIKTEEDAIKAMNIVHGKGVKVVVLSSLDSEGPELVTYASSKLDNEWKIWKVTSTRQTGIFTGTGDLFSALFLGWFAKLNQNVPKALETTLATMSAVLSRTKENGVVRKVESAQQKALVELQLIQSLDVIMKPVVKNTASAVNIPK